MNVYFITSDYESDKLAAAFEAAQRRGDSAVAADIVLEDDPAVSVAEELRMTTCLIDLARIVITFPDWRSGERTRLEEAYAESKGKQIYSVDNYIDDENRQWRPIQAPKAGEDPPEPAQKIVPEHGADRAGGIKGFLLIRCPNCGKEKRAEADQIPDKRRAGRRRAAGHDLPELQNADRDDAVTDRHGLDDQRGGGHMKFGELMAVLIRPDRALIRTLFDGESRYSEIYADGRLGSLLKDYEIVEMAIVKGIVSLKLKEAGE